MKCGHIALELHSINFLKKYSPQKIRSDVFYLALFKVDQGTATWRLLLHFSVNLLKNIVIIDLYKWLERATCTNHNFPLKFCNKNVLFLMYASCHMRIASKNVGLKKLLNHYIQIFLKQILGVL